MTGFTSSALSLFPLVWSQRLRYSASYLAHADRLNMFELWSMSRAQNLPPTTFLETIDEITAFVNIFFCTLSVRKENTFPVFCFNAVRILNNN